MAMLAESRRKKRYNLVPKGKPLFEDGDRFGTKMLEKMGWSKGKGLGSQENGQLDFVRIRYKNDVDGFGFAERDDQWTEHEKHFNGLLDTLNGENSTSANASDECGVAAPTVGFGFKSKSVGKVKLTDKFSGQSLEEKSKNSKARVHYKKFTKGKDMAQYSEKDLANIFGKKVSPDDDIYSQFQAFNAGDNKEDTVPLESGTNIVYTGMSGSDYFKMKMEAKKGLPLGNGVDNMEDEQPLKKKKKNKKPSSEENPESTENPANELGTKIINTGVSVNDYFKVKMETLKQKKVLPLDNNMEAGEDMACVAPIESDLFPIEEGPMKKKKNNKKQPVDEVLAEDSSVVEEPEVSSKNKKKKTKNSIVIQDEPDSPAVETSSVGLLEDGIPLKNKKSKKRSAEEVAATDDTQSLTNIPKKIKIGTPKEPAAGSTEIPNKKKNKQSTVTETRDEVENSQLEEETFPTKETLLTNNLHEERSETLPLVPSANEITSKKKKNNKKQPVDELLAEDSSVVEEPEVSAKNKKKKTKNSIVNQDEPDSPAVETSSVGLLEDGVPLKNKKSKKRSVEEVAATDDTQSLTNIQKKMNIETPEEPAADSTEIPKKKKNKQSTVTETRDEVENSQKNLAVEKPAELPEATEVPKKKKKNKQTNSAAPPSKKKTNKTEKNSAT